MGLFTDPSMMELLEGQRALLDDAFGAGAYDIASLPPGRHAAQVWSNLLEVRFGRERDGEITSLISLRNPPEGTCADAGTWLWAKFLGAEVQPNDRDQSGMVIAASEDQLRAEIQVIGRLIKETFANPQKLRDAAFYVDGYTRAYNDYCSGRWDPT